MKPRQMLWAKMLQTAFVGICAWLGCDWCGRYSGDAMGNLHQPAISRYGLRFDLGNGDAGGSAIIGVRCLADL